MCSGGRHRRDDERRMARRACADQLGAAVVILDKLMCAHGDDARPRRVPARTVKLTGRLWEHATAAVAVAEYAVHVLCRECMRAVLEETIALVARVRVLRAQLLF
jgi:hypothetical protein